MKRLAVVAALAVIVIAVWYLRRPSKSAATPAHTDAPATATPRNKPIDHVTKLAGPAERKQMADRIAAAQAARHGSASSSGSTGAMRAPPAPRLPASVTEAQDEEEPPISKTEIRAAMREVVPMLSECYEAAMPTLADTTVKFTAKMTLTGDPDVGTLIDADKIVDDAGKPLPPTFDDCLRSTFQTLALPPLAEGDTVEVNYPFMFAQREP